MTKTTFAPETLVRVKDNYPDADFHGREGLLIGYSDDRKPRAVVVFVGTDSKLESTRFLFDGELEPAS